MRSLLVLCLLLPCWLSARELVIGGILEPSEMAGSQRPATGPGCGSGHHHLRRPPRSPSRIELLDSGARLTRNAEGGVYDLLLSHPTSPERESYLLYPEQAHIRHSWHLFVRKDDLGRSATAPWPILKPPAHRRHQRLLLHPELTAAMADPAYRFQVIPINQLQLRKLIAGRIDVVPMSLVTAFAQIRKGA